MAKVIFTYWKYPDLRTPVRQKLDTVKDLGMRKGEWEKTDWDNKFIIARRWSDIDVDSDVVDCLFEEIKPITWRERYLKVRRWVILFFKWRLFDWQLKTRLKKQYTDMII